MQKSYEQPYRLGGETRFLIHSENDFGEIVLDGDGRLPTFDSSESLQAFAQKRKLKIRGQRPLLDLDAVLAWLEAPDAAPDCRTLYACWNLLGDMARSLGAVESYRGYDRRLEYLHEELLWGCNLETAWGGAPCTPEFGMLDVQRLREVIGDGLGILDGSNKRMEVLASAPCPPHPRAGVSSTGSGRKRRVKPEGGEGEG